MYILTVSASIDAPFLKELAGIENPWGYGPAADPEFQTLTFDESDLGAMTAALDDYDAAWLAKEKLAFDPPVNFMRDAKISAGFDFTHNGETYRIQSRQSDRENVIGLAIAAMGAIAAGKQPGDLEWLAPGQPFGFIAEDNRIIPLDAQGMMALYQRGLGFKMGTTLYARALKDAGAAAPDLAALQAIDRTVGWPA